MSTPTQTLEQVLTNLAGDIEADLIGHFEHGVELKPETWEERVAQLRNLAEHMKGSVLAPGAPGEDAGGRHFEEWLQAIEARAAAASPGPWTTEMGYIGSNRALFLVRGKGFDGVLFGRSYDAEETAKHKADTTFTAHARTDVPALVAAVRALQEQLATAKAQAVGVDWSFGADWTARGIYQAPIALTSHKLPPTGKP